MNGMAILFRMFTLGNAKGKGKVVPVLHHAMKAYWGSEGIPDLGTRWM
jgi:hypothetical protein